MAWDLIDAIRERGTTVVLVTHFMEEAERLCDRVAVLDRGRVIAIDSPQGLINTHTPSARVVFESDEADLGWLSEVRYVSHVERRGARVEVEGEGPLLSFRCGRSARARHCAARPAR